MSRLYELHICTFGARNYAHTVAALLDKDGTLFSHRILSRDECFDPASKTANLKYDYNYYFMKRDSILLNNLLQSFISMWR